VRSIETFRIIDEIVAAVEAVPWTTGSPGALRCSPREEVDHHHRGVFGSEGANASSVEGKTMVVQSSSMTSGLVPSRWMSLLVSVLALLVSASPVFTFSSTPSMAKNGLYSKASFPPIIRNSSSRTTFLSMARISKERREELGIGDDEDEYDLYKALDTNTDPLITKIIAGSLIVAILGLLVVGVIVPLTTDYGEGVCNPLLTGGRC